MPKFELLNQDGKKVSDIVLNDEIFGIEPNRQVLFDVVNAQRAAMRQGTHDVKNRSEVRGGGRKPWRQKGTGRARQGSIRAPQWRGGGVVFGPTPRSYDVKINKKVRQLAIKSVLSYKAQGSLLVLDTIKLDVVCTKDFVGILKNLDLNSTKTLFLVSENEYSDEVFFSSRNIQDILVLECKRASVYDILRFRKLVITKEAIKHFEEVLL